MAGVLMSTLGTYFTAPTGIAIADSIVAQNYDAFGFPIGTTSTTSFNVALRQNDFVIVMLSSDNLDTSDLTVSTSGYTAGQQGLTSSVRYGWWWKRMGAVPDTNVTITYGGATDLEGFRMIAVAFRGVNASTAFDATSPSVTIGTTGNPNPPAITTVTNNAWVIAMGFLDDDRVDMTAPSGYTLIRANGAGTTDTESSAIAMAYKLKTPAGLDDPAAFGGAGNDTWVAATAALRPA